jgi:hypothetical protein
MSGVRPDHERRPGLVPDQPTLVGFLRARLAEDEQVARAADSGPWRVDDPAYPTAIYNRDGHPIISGSQWGGEASIFDDPAAPAHIARHDPARVLAEVEAKRRIVHIHSEYDHGCPEHDGCDGFTFLSAGPCFTLRLLALPWAGHPDYREEWRP